MSMRELTDEERQFLELAELPESALPVVAALGYVPSNGKLSQALAQMVRIQMDLLQIHDKRLARLREDFSEFGRLVIDAMRLGDAIADEQREEVLGELSLLNDNIADAFAESGTEIEALRERLDSLKE